MRSNWSFIDISLGISLIAFILLSVLITVRLDLLININYLIISIPIFILTFFCIIIGLKIFITEIRANRRNNTKKKHRALTGLILAMISIGFAISQFLLAWKFDHLSQFKYIITIIPMYIAISLILVFLIISYIDSEYRKDKVKL